MPIVLIVTAQHCIIVYMLNNQEHKGFTITLSIVGMVASEAGDFVYRVIMHSLRVWRSGHIIHPSQRKDVNYQHSVILFHLYFSSCFSVTCLWWLALGPILLVA